MLAVASSVVLGVEQAVGLEPSSAGGSVVRVSRFVCEFGEPILDSCIAKVDG